MKYNTDWDWLKRVAEHSPKSFATKIRKRNTALLHALDRMWTTRKKNYHQTFKGRVGCPHCNRFCDECLWTQHHGFGYYVRYQSACVNAKFNSESLCTIPCLDYNPRDEEVHMYWNTSIKDYQRTRRFLKAHIEWANKPWWGTKHQK